MTVTFGGGSVPNQKRLEGGGLGVESRRAPFNGLSAILHSVTVKDARSCTANTSQTISQPPLLTASSTKVDASCNGAKIGWANVSTPGTTAPRMAASDGSKIAAATSPPPFNGLSAILH